MSKKLRFYFALLQGFLRRDRKRFTYGLIFLLLTIFVIRILLPFAYPKSLALIKELRKPTFVEGVVGRTFHPNPIFDTTETQKDISKLIYRGLTKVNSQGELESDLAEKFEKISDTEYLFHLRQDIYWHDGSRFTAADVLHTISVATDPQYSSPVASNFKDVKVQKVDDFTVKFILPEAFAPFPYSTTVGIIPKHISLKSFRPIGTGNFRVKNINGNKIILSSERINLEFKFYSTTEEAKSALKLGQIHGLAGISPQDAQALEKFGGKIIYTKTLGFRQTVAYFNTVVGPLGIKDFRQALVLSINKTDLVRTVGGPGAQPAADQLPSQNWVGKQKEFYRFDPEKAKERLKKAGFVEEAGGWKDKNRPLEITITTLDDPELNSISNFLQGAWSALGLSVKINFVDGEALKNDIIPNRNFEVLINFQDVPADPDQYVLWHTTQVGSLNITGIKSAKLDKILEDGRKAAERNERGEKYTLFTKLLLDEAPALFLYYPQFTWVVSDDVSGVDLSNFTFSYDRFDSIDNWKFDESLF